MGKGEIAHFEQFHLFPQCFLCNLYLKIFFIATFQLSYAASLNLGQSQNLVFRELVKISSLSKESISISSRRPYFTRICSKMYVVRLGAIGGDKTSDDSFVSLSYRLAFGSLYMYFISLVLLSILL